MMHLPLQQLRRFAKQCKVERFRSSAKALAAALEANIAYVAAQRASDAFAPKDTASVLRFLASDDASQKVWSPNCTSGPFHAHVGKKLRASWLLDAEGCALCVMCDFIVLTFQSTSWSCRR